MVREIVRRVLDHPDANRAELACLPGRYSRLPGMLSLGDGRPVRNAKGDTVDVQCSNLLEVLKDVLSNDWRGSGCSVTWTFHSPESIAERRQLELHWRIVRVIAAIMLSEP
jgi:hypothetical protein